MISQTIAERAPIDIVASLESLSSRCVFRRLHPISTLSGFAGVKVTASRSLRNALPWAKVIALSHDTHCAYLRVQHRLIDTPLEGLIEAIRGP